MYQKEDIGYSEPLSGYSFSTYTKSSEKLA